ncbi:VOC family protein [Actinosynnema sp. NPDC020468]|uniref:VOC family protein n=1 Tax=Actinosynnema sp. NPDC020468 TaxID=3154488 RepID=UPI0033C9FB2E
MLRGLTTTSFYAHDLDAARTWYTDLFGTEPYFVVPGGYLEWRIGDYHHEFGVVNAAYAPHDTTTGPAGAIAYWCVDDVHTAHADLLARGATPHHPPTDRGTSGFTTASVVDPFGNVLGVMTNPHYHDVLRTLKP